MQDSRNPMTRRAWCFILTTYSWSIEPISYAKLLVKMREWHLGEKESRSHMVAMSDPD